MPVDEILSTIAELGAQGRRGALGPWAILGALIGAGVGGYLGYLGGDVGGLIAGVLPGALVGWLIALPLRGAAIFLVIFVLILAVTLGWQWLTGAFG